MKKKTYYAVCNCNGPVSVRLGAATLDEALDEFANADVTEWIDAVDAEDDFGIDDGYEMSERQFAETLRAAGLTPVKDLDPISHLTGGWYLWEYQSE